MNLSIIWSIAAFISAAIGAFAADAEPKRDNPAFQVGEKLIYNIEWGFFSVGRATMEVKAIEKVDGRDCYYIVAEARTSGLGDMLFQVRSKVETWLDVEGLFVRKYAEERSEGKKRHNEAIAYDYDNKITTIKNRETGSVTTHPLNGPVVDAVGLLYAARARQIGIETSGTFTCNTGETDYEVFLKADELKEMKTKPTGNVSALRFEPNPTLKIVSKHGGRAWFWISNDERRLPMQACSKMKIGTAKLELVEIENPKPKSDELLVTPRTNFGSGRKRAP
jgi:hypothetical protein